MTAGRRVAAFGGATTERSGVYSFERREAAKLRAPSRSAGSAPRRRLGVVPEPAAVVPAHRAPLGGQRQARRDARAPARDADRGLRERPHDQAADAVIRSRPGCAKGHMTTPEAVLDIPAAGVRIEIRKTAADTAGELLEFDVVGRARGLFAQEHLHIVQTERHEVIEGSMRLILDGREHLLRAGDVMEVPPGTPHRQLPGGDGTGRVRVQLRPAPDRRGLPRADGVDQAQSLGLSGAGRRRRDRARLRPRGPRHTAVVPRPEGDVLGAAAPRLARVRVRRRVGRARHRASPSSARSPTPAATRCGGSPSTSASTPTTASPRSARSRASTSRAACRTTWTRARGSRGSSTRT